MAGKKVLIVGAGPGGLSAGMLLAHAGFDVEIYEKRGRVGGRNGYIQAGDYKFDLGPTFFLMKDVLENLFESCGRRLEDYVQLMQLDPIYQLVFKDRRIMMSSDRNKMMAELERVFPGSSGGYRKYLDRESKKHERLIPCLEVPYGKFSDYFSKRLLRASPYLDVHQSLYDVLGRYFDDETLRICFTFQAKYIGMSPWEAPGLFSILSYVEHVGGIYHIKGGLNNLSVAMSKVFEEFGGRIHLGAGVKKIIVEAGETKGLELNSGEEVRADYVIINADFAHAMKYLVDNKHRRKYTDSKLDSMKYSCSTFMMYLGLDKKYENVEHHNIYFADDYKGNVSEITEGTQVPEDPSFYVHNPSMIDDSLAADGKSAIYILVPVGNSSGGIDWGHHKEMFKERILDMLEKKAGMNDIREHIEELIVLCPDDWEQKMGVYNGATFNLGHNIGQMLYFRPHNDFEEFKNCYLVGGGTHPGSGLPTIFESGRITSELIMEREHID